MAVFLKAPTSLGSAVHSGHRTPVRFANPSSWASTVRLALNARTEALRTEAEMAAVQVLSVCWDGTPPVQPTTIARAMGIEVARVSLDADLAGKLEKKPARPARMSVSTSIGDVHCRFTVAHEIGHFMRNANREEYEYVHHRDPISSLGVDDDEMFANAFAAALLMPQGAVEALIALGIEERQMARELRVSEAAMVFRLKRLNSYPLAA